MALSPPWPERKIALKCDRCLYMETPVCVDVCPTRALELIDVDQYEDFIRDKRIETAKSLQDKKGLGGKLLLDLVHEPGN